MKQIAIAPNAFRGSLGAFAAATCIAEGLTRSRLACNPILIPLADGGDGTLEVIHRGLGGEKISIPVTRADGSKAKADLGLMSDGQTAIVELAQASGIEQIRKDERNPLTATSYGTGELIRAAVERGFKRIIVGLGGSANNDGGAGCMQALGARLRDEDGQDLEPGGAALARLATIDAAPLQNFMDGVEVIALCDVDNPLIGERGASAFFGPQKGATPAMVKQLDDALAHFAAIIRRDLGPDIAYVPGSGAAGGIGGGLIAFCNAQLAPGAETIIGLLGYEQSVQGADILITGEGKLDAQTRGGKGVQAAADLALRNHVPAIALVGTLDCTPADLVAMNLDAAFSILPHPCTLEEATAHAAEWLSATATQVGNLLAAWQK